MTANSVIVNANGYQQHYDLLNENELVSVYPVEIDYQSDNSSSLSYTDLSGSASMDIPSPSTVSMSSASSNYPELTIEGELKDQLRFRYKSEKGCHGGLKPIIRLHKCESYHNIWIKVTLYTCGSNPTLHILELDGKDVKDGVGWKQLSKDFIAKFSSLAICMRKKDEISELLKGRIKEKYKEQKRRISEKDLEKEIQEKVKTFNVNSGLLYFEAFYDKDESQRVCEGIFSQPIYNQKCTLAGELKITRLSSFSGKTKGNEDMILLCEKIRKEDIEIIFSCKNMNWQEKAQFNPADVHHQVAIPFKTPKFPQNVEQEVDIRLCRKSDGKAGEPRTFVYRQCDDYDDELPLKRKRPNPSDDVSMPMSEIENDCTSIMSDYGNIPSISELNGILEELYREDYRLPFEQVTPEGILNMASLNLSESPSVKKEKTDQGWTSSRSEVEPAQMLKSGLIDLLKSRGTFIRFLPALLSMKDENGNTLLHLVVMEKSDNLPLVVKMVEAATNGLLNQTNKAKMTPLHIAVSKSLWKVARILLMSGANPDIKDKNGNTCIHLAAMYSFPICLAEILAPFLGIDKKRKHLPNINLLNYEGLSPLHIAVQKESPVCIQLLIRAKANMNIPDGKSGKTPLHFAYEKNNDDLVNLLRSQRDLKLNVEDFNGNTPNSCAHKLQKNSSVMPKPTECCIELSTESSNSNEDDCFEIIEEKFNISEKDKIEKNPISIENGEDMFCKTLDSNKLWKKLGLYVMDEKEINVIEVMDNTPTKTILNELKKLNGEKYAEKLKFILSDDEELNKFTHLLKVKL